MDIYEIEDDCLSYCLTCMFPTIDNNCVNKGCISNYFDYIPQTHNEDVPIKHSNNVDLCALHPKLFIMLNRLVVLCAHENIEIMITQGYRSIEEQNKIYAQGRTLPGKIVTKAKGGSSLHNFRLAFDVAILKNNKIDWNDTELYIKVGKLGKGIGLTWGGNVKHGGDFKTMNDMPHFQFTGGHPISYFQNGNNLII